MLLSFNKDNLQLPEMVLTDELYRDYTKFMNFLMIEIYATIFQKRLNFLMMLKFIARFYRKENRRLAHV